MKISTFMPITNPKKRGDTYLEAIKTHLYFSDELVVVDGGSTDGSLEEIAALNDPRIRVVTLDWPQKDWSWIEFPKHWNFGLENSTGDWVAAGETDHIFHEGEIARVRPDLERADREGKAVVYVEKMQSGHHQKWYSKSKMYYFVNKKKFPNIRYGFDSKNPTDLCVPIFWDGSFRYGLEHGTAIMDNIESNKHLISGCGAKLYNFLWTFKTYEQVVAERQASARAWNKYAGFVDEHGITFKEKPEEVREWITNQIKSVQQKAKTSIPLLSLPKVMQEKIKRDLKPEHIGAQGLWYSHLD